MKNKSYIPVLSGFAVILACLLFSCLNVSDNDWLKKGFIQPPDTARPGVYWYFMDGNIDKKAITDDLESMKKAGIGYVIFLEVNVGVPRGRIDFMSNEWIDLFTHAVRESERLGIHLIMGSGPGWAGSGGPWVEPRLSMMHIVAADTTVDGPLLFDATLPLPRPVTPFFGERTLTEKLKQLRDDWYEDVRIIAFPAPPRISRIGNLEEKAFYYRAPYTSQPGVAPFIPLPTDTANRREESIRKEKIIDLTPLGKEGGRLTWNVPPGRWIIIRFVKRNNGAVTRPAPMPGLGFESDKFDTAALGEHFRAYTGKLIDKARPLKSSSTGGWTMLHIDSWEMGAQNWSHRFLDEFIIRRGYDPMLYMPVFAGYIVNTREESERFLWDVRQTASELIVENHAGYFKTLGRKYGFRLSIEPYDMNPASDFDLGAVADIPMGEFWSAGYGFNSSFSCIEATSIGHVTGRPVIAAEAFTADHTEAWKKYPGNMKNQTDWALALGINRLIFHTFAHKTHGDKYLPGMTMGPYGVHWDRGQTWWSMVKGYHTYLSRSQFMLMQGDLVADILFLTPEGAPCVFVPPASVLEGTDTLPDKRGYSFDACSPGYLIKYASAVNGKIVFPSGASYSLLVIPSNKYMTPELLGKIDNLLRTGASVAASRPVKSPSLSRYPSCDEEVRRLSETIWGIHGAHGKSQIKYINGTLFNLDEQTPVQPVKSIQNNNPYDIYPLYDTLASFLKLLGVENDFVSLTGKIRYHHRKLPGRDIYFISNRTGKKITDTCFFRDGTAMAELWDPMTGEIRKLDNVTAKIKGAFIPLRLEPWQSYFIVFYADNEGYRRLQTGQGNDFPGKDELLVIDGPWKVSFDTARGGPGEVTFSIAQDWTQRKEPGIKYYSGIAVYRCTFDLPAGTFDKKTFDYYIRTEPVNGMARVRLNGREAGILWSSPWELKISVPLKEKGNQLEIEVANLWINRLIGDEHYPWDGITGGQWPEWLLKGEKRPTQRFTFTTHRYYKKDDQIVPSGLTNPVKILYLPRKRE